MNMIARALLIVFLVMVWVGSASAQRMFAPSAPASTAVSSTTTTTSAIALTLPSPAPRNMVVRVFNGGTTPVFINFGTSSGVTATLTTSIPIAAAGVSAFVVPEGTTHVATIIAAGTASVYFTVGEGII
jgi:hypothetical protein